MSISEKVKCIIMPNLRHFIFDVKTKILTDFHICISVPLSKMEGIHTRKGFSKSAEGNLLHSCLSPDIRTCILVTDGSFGKQIVLFEVFL